MSAGVTDATRQAIEGGAGGSLSTTVGLVAVLLLLCLALLKEVMRTSRGGGEQGSTSLGMLDIAIVPLLFAAAVVIGSRLLSLLLHGTIA